MCVRVCMHVRICVCICPTVLGDFFYSTSPAPIRWNGRPNRPTPPPGKGGGGYLRSDGRPILCRVEPGWGNAGTPGGRKWGQNWLWPETHARFQNWPSYTTIVKMAADECLCFPYSLSSAFVHSVVSRVLTFHVCPWPFCSLKVVVLSLLPPLCSASSSLGLISLAFFSTCPVPTT